MKQKVTNFFRKRKRTAKNSPGRSDRRALIGLGAITVLTHFHWLFNFRVFTSGDWWFISLEKYRDFVTLSPIWVTDGFGGTSATPGFYLIRFFEGLLSTVGSSFMLNEKLFFFVPITFIGIFGAYLFLRQYFKAWLSFVGALVFAFNSAMLFNYAGALTIAVADALTPLALYLFRQLLHSPKDMRLLWANAFVFTIMALYEMRIALLVMAIAGGLFLYLWLTEQNKRDYIKQRIGMLSKLGLLLFALQAFWLIPYVIGSRAGVTFSNLLGQGLFASFSDIQNALTLRHPFWTGARPATFVAQPIPLYAWLIPLAAFGGFLFRRRRVHREIGYWALLAILGLFLVKQVNEPLVNAYPWIFDHIPGFAAFRESSKFYLLISLAYAVMIPYTLGLCRNWLKEHVKRRVGRVPLATVLFYSGSTVVLLLFMVNMKPLVTGELRTLYIPRQMPADYARFNQFTDSQPDYFRALWLPTVPRWVAQTSQHPSLSATNLSQGAWQRQLSEAGLSTGATLKDKATNVFDQATSPAFLERGSVKYVVVPLRDSDNEDDFLHNYGDDRQYYIDVLERQPYLKKVNTGSPGLAVYENLAYQPHVSAQTALQTYDLSQDAPLNPLFTFVSTELGQKFNFVEQAQQRKAGSAYPATSVTDPFQDIRREHIQKDAVTKSLPAMQKPELYIDSAQRDMRYSIQNGTITFYAKPRNTLTVNGQPIGPKAGSETAVASQKLAPGNWYILASGDKLLNLDGSNGQASLGVPERQVRLYGVTGKNLVANGSFEQGAWQDQVEDCNNYDEGALLFMDVARKKGDATDGRQSLQLEADKHTACTTSAPIPVKGRSYVLGFDHRVVGGQKAGYKLTFNDPAKTVIKKDIDASGTWQHYQTIIEVPAGATSFTMTPLGYPDYRFRNHAVTNYDNLVVAPADQLVELHKAPPVYAKIPLAPDQKVRLAYQNHTANQGKNLVANGSFEQGAWQKKVADCNNYDDQPAISMQLGDRDNDGKMLELEAKRHAACTTSPSVPMEQGSRYVLSFDYQSDTASRASYTITYNDLNKTKAEGSLPIKSGAWQTFTKQLQPPLGTTGMTITVYAYGGDSGSETFINRYDNFAVSEVPTTPGQYYVVDNKVPQLAQPDKITARKAGSTKEIIEVKGARTPFYVAQSESYNPLWRLALANKASEGMVTKFLPWAKVDAVPDKAHLKLNDFQNGWYVDPAQLCAGNKPGCVKNTGGSYDMQLVADFLPQRWFYIGSVISFTACLMGIGYLLYRYLDAKKRQKGNTRQ